jgi:hypothetical protein
MIINVQIRSMRNFEKQVDVLKDISEFLEKWMIGKP